MSPSEFKNKKRFEEIVTQILGPDTDNVELYPIDIAKYQSLWSSQKIKGTPTVIYYKNRQEVNRIVGEHSEEEYKNFLLHEVD